MSNLAEDIDLLLRRAEDRAADRMSRNADRATTELAAYREAWDQLLSFLERELAADEQGVGFHLDFRRLHRQVEYAEWSVNAAIRHTATPRVLETVRAARIDLTHESSGP